MHGVSQANILSICSYYFHLLRASSVNIDRMGSWSCKQMLWKLHKLVAQPSKHYYLLEIRITFHQSSNKADPFLPPSSTAVINTWICIFLQNLCPRHSPPLLWQKSYHATSRRSTTHEPLTKTLSCHQHKVHHTWAVKGHECLSLRNIQLLDLRLMRLCTPIILVINITTMRKIVN